MIGIIVIGVIVGYILLSKFIVTKVLQSYGLKKANIALAIMILIPTWDVILGFPIYAYLCMFESGTKIYKTVDNVEGFYVGKKSLSDEPIEPYKGYKFIEYKEMDFSRPTGKYYRSYWADYWYDKKIADMCVYPLHPNNTAYSYTEAFNKGKCIVKEEIAEGEVSRWEVKYSSLKEIDISFLGIEKIQSIYIVDRLEKKRLSERKYIWWKAGYVIGYLLTGSSSHLTPRGFICDSQGNLLNQTLKTKKGN